MTLILREADVQEVIEMDDVITAVTAAMKELGEGVAQNEPRRRAFAPGGLLNVMFASYPGGRCTGLKAYTVADGKVRFLVVLFALVAVLTDVIDRGPVFVTRRDAGGLQPQQLRPRRRPF